METLEIIFTIVAGLVALITIPWGIARTVANKIANTSGKIAVGADNVAELLSSFGLEKLSLAIKEGADIPDELEDLARVFAERTADNDLSKEDIKALFEEGKELWVEMKDFRVKVFPKKKK
jgi:hypothetical protein